MHCLVVVAVMILSSLSSLHADEAGMICYQMMQNGTVVYRSFADAVSSPTAFDACFPTRNKEKLQSVLLLIDVVNGDRQFEVSFDPRNGDGSNVTRIRMDFKQVNGQNLTIMPFGSPAASSACNSSINNVANEARGRVRIGITCVVSRLHPKPGSLVQVQMLERSSDKVVRQAVSAAPLVLFKEIREPAGKNRVAKVSKHGSKLSTTKIVLLCVQAILLGILFSLLILLLVSLFRK